MGILAALAVVVTLVSVFSINTNVFDMWVVLVFGLLGYMMRKTGFEPGPLILAFVLGPIMERFFRQSLLISNGDPTIFFTRPISGTLIVIAALIIVLSAVQFFRKRSRERAGGAEACIAAQQGHQRADSCISSGRGSTRGSHDGASGIGNTR